jgi:hypothetical protein
MKAIYRGTVVLGGMLSLATVNCNHKDESARAREPRFGRDSSTAEQRRAEERREERRTDERRTDERRTDERRTDEREDGRFVGGGPADPSSAVAKIASARCEREVKCNNVGSKEKYSTRADCVTRMQDDKRDAVNEKDCPGGIDRKQLNACLSAIRDEACGNPLDSISRLVSCRSGSICLK